MNVLITNDKVVTAPIVLTSGSYGTELTFSFDDEQWDALIKKAVFGDVEQLIEDDKCIIPSETTENVGNVQFGVYGYEVSDDELILRLSPQPTVISVIQGSYNQEANEAAIATPTPYEELQAEIAKAQENWRQIFDFTLEEDVTLVERLVDDDGNAFNLRKAKIIIETPTNDITIPNLKLSSETPTNDDYLDLYFETEYIYNKTTSARTKRDLMQEAGLKLITFEAKPFLIGEFIGIPYTYEEMQEWGGICTEYAPPFIRAFNMDITDIDMFRFYGNQLETIPTGTRFIMWGVNDE